jgi:uncharacterized membrane protein
MHRLLLKRRRVQHPHIRAETQVVIHEEEGMTSEIRDVHDELADGMNVFDKNTIRRSSAFDE